MSSLQTSARGFKVVPDFTLRDEVLDELVRERERLAEADEVFGVHGFSSFENGGLSVPTHFECAAAFVLFFVENSWLGRDGRSC